MIIFGPESGADKLIRIRTVPDHTVMERYGRVEGEPPVPAAPED